MQNEPKNIPSHIKFHADIINILMMVGININDAAVHFTETFNKVKNCPANYNSFGLKKDNVWILRDYYPGTPIMFNESRNVYNPPHKKKVQ